jgi:tetratricopeptide (TPR) repeat protein
VSKKIGAFLFVFLLFMQKIYGDTLANYSVEYSKAITLMEHHQYHEAIVIMDALSKTNKNYNLLLSLGDAYAALEKPKKALHYYKMVYHHATITNNVLFTRVALFKMARMQLWTNNTKSAIKSYQLLLSMTLSKSDKTIAQAGLTTASNIQAQNLIKKEHQLYENTLRQARDDIQLSDGKRAYGLIKNYIDNDPNVNLYLIAADSLSITNNPKKSLEYYQQALQSSQDITDKKYALFGMARMQFWLSQYVRAGKTYQLLLQYHLNPKEHELALAGLVKSLAYYNRPRSAYYLIPNDLQFTTPELVIASSQASSWANWSDISKSTLIKYEPITQKINLNSSLGKDLQDLQWQTKLATSPSVITPSVFYARDSEGFTKTRSILDYTHYWSQLAQTSVGVDDNLYTQNKPYKLNANGIYLGQTLRPTRELILQGQVEPTEYKNLTSFARSNWSPVLWNTNISYTPNDYVSLRALALREVIETFPAFADRITDNQYATSLTVNPLPYVQLNGAYSRLNMSDSNNRNVYFLSSSVLLLPNYGLTATGILREYTDKFTSPDYFSPYNYKAATILLKLGRKLGATWHYYLDGGVGRQFIISRPDSTTAASPTYQWGLGITGPITSWLVLNAYFADTHQTSPFLGSPEYHYQYGGVSLNIMM